jgi:hypothetical protein
MFAFKKNSPPLCIFANDLEVQTSDQINFLYQLLNQYAELTEYKKYLLLPETLESKTLNLLKVKAAASNFQIFQLPHTESFSQSISIFFDKSKKIDSIVASDIYSLIKSKKIINRLTNGKRRLGLLLVDAEKLDNHNWRLCAIDGQGSFKGWVDFYTKLISGRVKGVLGVYYITRELITPSFSLNKDFLPADIDVINVNEFDYMSLRGDQSLSNNQHTIFCDLDGTLVEHDANPSPTKPLAPLDATNKFVRFIEKSNSKLVICTARKYDKALLAVQLKAVGIEPFDIITNCTSGQRILINDFKPRTILRKGAHAINIKRNLGLAEFSEGFNMDKNDEKLLAIMDGRSGAHTWLILDSLGRKRVKKFVPEESGENLMRLKTQFYDLVAYSKLFPNVFLMPELVSGNEEKFSFYLNYIENKAPNYNDEINVLNHAIAATKMLRQNFYKYPKHINLSGALKIVAEEKVLPRLDWIERESTEGRLNITQAAINSIKDTINTLLENALSNQIVSIGGLIHGDLTLENILFSINEDIFLVDVQSESGDIPWISDYGKLLQSVLCGYEAWNYPLAKWLDVLKCRINDYSKGLSGSYRELIIEWRTISGMNMNSLIYYSLLYMLFHVIRMVPYQCKSSLERGQMAVNVSISISYSINKLIK